MAVELTGSLIWAREDGVTLDLNDGENIKLRHHDGFGIPEFTHSASASPGVAGDYWFGVQYPPRIVTLDLVLYANGLTALQDLRAQVIAALNPTIFKGTLKMTQVNGVERWFDCVLAESLPMPTMSHIGHHAMMLTVRFRSVRDPFLYDPVAKLHVVTTSEEVLTDDNFMLEGFQFPFILSQSGVFNAVELDYAGHVPTPVDIVLTGPSIEPVLRNETLMRSVGFFGSGLTMPTGAVLHVNMDPRDRAVEYQGLNGWPYVRESAFWWLQPGINNLNFEIGGTSDDTQLVMTYFDRFLGF